MQYKLVVVILTYNEAIHIERAIKNVSGFSDKIIVLDSYSQDNTAEISQQLSAEVIFRKFDNYKNQRQFAIDYCKNLTKWMFFLDADEYLLEETKNEIKNILEKSTGVSGYYINRRAIFMDRWLKHGGYYPCYFMRLFKPDKATVDGEINEHVVITGVTKKLKNDVVDHNLKNIFSWTEKHNKYTTLEAERLFTKKTNAESKIKKFHIQSERKKWVRENIWNRLPLLCRPFIYFTYRYFFRLGFLDGKEGFIYHILQGGWLWFLVDVKCIEMKLKNDKFGENLNES